MAPTNTTFAQAEGQRYLESLPRERRRSSGQVYTPPGLADFVLRQAGFGQGPHRADCLLDPACGAGVFLERAVAALSNQLGPGPALLDAIEAQLFGIDLDATACEMTRRTVRQAAREHARCNVRPAFFRDNVRQADFLFDDDASSLARRVGGFAFVVGNPPYVATNRLDAEYKDRLRHAFRSASGRLDLYSVFMERALEFAAVGGRVALLTPDKFLVSQSARALRALLLKGNAVRSIARFRSHKVFGDAATVPCVTVVERGATSRNVAVLECEAAPTDRGEISVRDRTQIAQRSLSSAPWHVHRLDRHELARRLQASHPTLAQHTVRVSAGPATGRDGVFVFPRGEHTEIEPDLLRPAVRGRDLGAFRIEDPGLDALVPYTFDAMGNPSLIRLADFPGTRRYLQRHRAELEERHCVRVWRKPWYDLHDQMLSDLARLTKILVPDVANTNRFVVDRGRYLPLHSVYYLAPRDGVNADYLCAILNSPVAHFLVRLFSPVVKDGFNRYRQQFIATLPIPMATPDQARAIVDAAARGRAEDLDEAIAWLFRLSPREYASLAADDGEGA